MDRFDFIQLIGSQTCAAANRLTQFLASEPACTWSESWNMGVLVLAAPLITFAVLVALQSRREGNH